MKYVLSVLGFIILTVIAITLLASTTSNRSETNQEGDKVVTVVDYKNNGTAIYTIQGELVADEEFRQIRISVNQSERRVQVLAGYNERVEREQRFGNNAQAFEVFMEALGKAGYSLKRETKIKQVDGTCPLGRRYLYKLQADGKEVVDLWSTSCSTKEGNFGGNDSLIRRLFENQIPEFNEFVSGVDI